MSVSEFQQARRRREVREAENDLPSRRRSRVAVLFIASKRRGVMTL